MSEAANTLATVQQNLSSGLQSAAKVSHHVRNGRLGGRPPGQKHKQNKITQAMKQSSVYFFSKLIDDETEGRLWMAFITGQTPVLDRYGKQQYAEDGTPLMIKVENLNPISLRAFMRAVEYKRGMPIQLVHNSGENADSNKVVYEFIGATPEFFENQAKILNLVKK